jgi:SAM-dependent methyltransferase
MVESRRNAGRAATAVVPGKSAPAARGAGRFDAAYYERFYGAVATRVADHRKVQRLAAYAVACLRFLDLPVRSVLDLGCGLGHWRTALRRLAPKASYRGVEFSPHLCARLGWTRGSVVDYAPRRRFDLVVCQGVLQYLDDRDATRAIDNLSRLCGGALYLEALTERDWRCNCDRTVTDGDVHLRPGSFYRRRLARHFHAIGGGMFVHRRAPVTLFELETLA